MRTTLLSVAVGVALLPACQSVPGDPPSSSSAPNAGEGLRTVAGDWKFSHSGPSPVGKEGSVDPSKIMAENLAGSRISIAANGEASMMAMGQSGTFKVELLEETPIYVKIGSHDPMAKNPWTYDKKTRLLAVPVDVRSNGSEGKMPVYYRRTGR